MDRLRAHCGNGYAPWWAPDHGVLHRISAVVRDPLRRMLHSDAAAGQGYGGRDSAAPRRTSKLWGRPRRIVADWQTGSICRGARSEEPEDGPGCQRPR